jgi:DNA gyrase subunit A
MLVVTDQGYGKRTRMKDYPLKGRGGLGVKTVQLTKARGQLAGALAVQAGYQVMLISNGGTVIRMPVDEIKRLGRATQGVIVMRLRGDEQVSSIALVAESETVPVDDSPEAPVEPDPVPSAGSDKNE